MKKYYRYDDNYQYWEERWSKTELDLSSFINTDIYPVKYAKEIVRSKEERILEIGCGLGRLVDHFYNLGHDITGIDRSKIAINNILKYKKNLKVKLGDVNKLNFKNESFDVIFAFGVYHNIEFDLDKAIKEFSRVLKKNGRFVISMRPDNLETYLNERYWLFKNRKKKNKEFKFHKLAVKEKEFENLLLKLNLKVKKIDKARNMSFLFRFTFLRALRSNDINEKYFRSRGYELNKIGKLIDKTLRFFFPFSFCNVLVFSGKKIR